jgi:competence protein CoiA
LIDDVASAQVENRKQAQSRRMDALEVGCTGLLDGVACNLYTHKEHAASLSVKANGPFYCKQCNSDAVLHKCIEKIDHFAHFARLSPVLGPQETALHRKCKEEICHALAMRHPNGKWEVERPIRANAVGKIPELRPDISGRIGWDRVAIEVQVSALSLNTIASRSTAYSKRGIALLWVVPLFEPLGDDPFRPRLFERYLHSLYYGRIYYWWPGQGLSIVPIHYMNATKYVEYREWSEDGVVRSGGGYDLEYKIIKTPLAGSNLSIDTDFELHHRPEFTPENERKSVPACIVWKDRSRPWWDVS